ncbi:MAG: outer membrane protein assembly factor BamB, partial [Gammaproteobacteria bacterium]
TYMAVMLIASIYGVWFLVASGQTLRCKLTTFGVLGVAVGAVVFLGDLRGWTGSMTPVVRWIWESQEDRSITSVAAADDELAPTGGLDLIAQGPTDFPGYLGVGRDARVGGVDLSTDWSSTPPELLWRVPSGLGWSGFAIVNSVAITHEEFDGQSHVVARDAMTGAEHWRYSHDSSFEHVLGGSGPRATPAIDEGYVYAQDAHGLLLCIDGADGSLVWQDDLLARFGVTPEIEAATIQYGRSGSPLIHGDLVIIPAGGDPDSKRAGIVAFDKRTGEVRWEGPPRAISHASPTVATLLGVEQFLVMNEGTVSGHSLADGALLWEHSWPGSTPADANNSQPVVVGDGQVLVSKGYGSGSSLLSLKRTQTGDWSVTALWAQRRSLRTKLTTAVVRDGHAFGLSDGMLECISLSDGKRVWKEGRFGHGQLLLVGEHLLILSEEGELLLVEASAKGEGELLGRFPVLEGKTWNTFAMMGELVVLRNGQEAAAVRLPRAEE